MLASNYRIVQTEQGFSIFKVYYDAAGRMVRRDQMPAIDAYSDTACGVTDWLEAISLAAEKPSVSLDEFRSLTGSTALSANESPDHEEPD